MFACLFVFFFGLYAGVLQRPVTVDRSDCLLTRLLTQYRATLPPSSCVSSCEKRSDFQNHHLLQPVSTYPVIVTQQVELARLTCTQSSHAARSAAGRQLDKWPQWGGDEWPEWDGGDQQFHDLANACSWDASSKWSTAHVENTIEWPLTKHKSHVCVREVENSMMILNQRFVRWRWKRQKTMVS